MRTKANEIIVSLLQSDEFNNCMKKVKPSLKQDLTGELSLILLETDPQKIVDLHEKKVLTFYIVRIILRLAFSKTSPFYKKYRMAHAEFIDNDVPDECSANISRIQQEERALLEIEKLEWYEQEMVKLYLKEGTYRAMSEATKIPVMSCFQAIKIATEKIQRAI